MRVYDVLRLSDGVLLKRFGFEDQAIEHCKMLKRAGIRAYVMPFLLP